MLVYTVDVGRFGVLSRGLELGQILLPYCTVDGRLVLDLWGIIDLSI